jgi:hypothetical protein
LEDEKERAKYAFARDLTLTDMDAPGAIALAVYSRATNDLDTDIRNSIMNLYRQINFTRTQTLDVDYTTLKAIVNTALPCGRFPVSIEKSIGGIYLPVTEILSESGLYLCLSCFGHEAPTLSSPIGTKFSLSGSKKDAFLTEMHPVKKGKTKRGDPIISNERRYSTLRILRVKPQQAVADWEKIHLDNYVKMNQGGALPTSAIVLKTQKQVDSIWMDLKRVVKTLRGEEVPIVPELRPGLSVEDSLAVSTKKRKNLGVSKVTRNVKRRLDDELDIEAHISEVPSDNDESEGMNL